MGQAVGTLMEAPVALVRTNPAALRAVDKESEDFAQLMDSIGSKGVLNPVLGTKRKDVETGEEYILLVDGLQRFTASKELGFETIPMLIHELDELATLEAQIITNIQGVDTKPTEYAKALHRMRALYPALTMAEFAAKLSVSVTWLNNRFKLTNLIDQAKQLVDEGAINVTNAIDLAKLPEGEQADWVEQAQIESPAEFVPKVKARISAIKKANREGKDVKEITFEDVVKPIVRKKVEILEELETKAVGNSLCNKLSITTGEAGFALGVSWAMNMDPDTLEVKRADWEEKKAVRAEKAAKAKEERAARAEELKKADVEATA